jgi:serine/threonine protein kinase
MAPEQVSGRRGDVRTDVYALGTILFEMLTGELPYGGSNVYTMMKAKTSEDPQPPSRFRADLDLHLEEIVLHAIARLPRDRYPTSAQMLEDLRDPSQVKLEGRASRLHPQDPSSRRLRSAMGFALFFASLIAVFIFLIWLANRYPAPASGQHRSYRGQVR